MLFTCTLNTASAAIWQPVTDGLSIPNAPSVLAITDNLTHDFTTESGLGALTVGAKYKLTLQPALSTAVPPASPSDYIEGWVKVAATGGTITAEGGRPIQSKIPIFIIPVTGKDHVYFMRSLDTPVSCKLFLVREDV